MNCLVLLLLAIFYFEVANGETVKYISQNFQARTNLNTPQANIALGTPPQNTTVLLDTGSWNAFIPGSINGYPENKYSVYNASSSSTFSQTRFLPNMYWNQPTSSDFKWFVFDQAYFGEGQGAGQFNTSFVMQTTFQTPIFGLDVNSVRRKPYDSVIMMMREAGLIRNLSFAISYNDDTPDNYDGNFMFGAIDYSKFTGKLVAIPLNKGRLQVDNPIYYERGDGAQQYTVDDPFTLSYQQGTTTMFDTGGVNFNIDSLAYTDIKRILGTVNGKFQSSVIKNRKPVIEYSLGGGKFKFTIDLYKRLPQGNPIGFFKGMGQSTSKMVQQGPGLFKYVYTVWDYENERMLFGNPNPNPGAPDIRYLTEDIIQS